jgi:hypothetical protein
LTSALVGGEWSASLLCHFTPGERAPGTHSIGGLVDPRAGLDDVKERIFLTLDAIRPLYLGCMIIIIIIIIIDLSIYNKYA